MVSSAFHGDRSAVQDVATDIDDEEEYTNNDEEEVSNESSADTTTKNFNEMKGFLLRLNRKVDRVERTVRTVRDEQRYIGMHV